MKGHQRETYKKPLPKRMTPVQRKLGRSYMLKNEHSFLRNQCEEDFPTMASLKAQLRNIETIRSLNETGICVLDNFLDNELSYKINETTKDLYRNLPDLFYPATLMSDNSTQSTFRSDNICWVSGNESSCRCYANLRDKFDRFLYTIMKEYRSYYKKSLRISHKSKLQVSCFPAGSHGYKPHVDNPVDGSRLLTLVYYPNDGYDQANGGCTRFYLKNKKKFVDIEPKANRIVLHWSDSRVIQETLPCHANIFSLKTWYFGESHK